MDVGRRSALKRIAEAEEKAGRRLSTEERLDILADYESELQGAIAQLERELPPLERELEALNRRGFFGKLRAIPRARELTNEIGAIRRGIAGNRLRLRGVAIAREQVLGRIRRLPGDPF